MQTMGLPCADRFSALPTVSVPRTRWQRLAMILKVVELRSRFIVLMAGTALLFGAWDTVVNHVEHWCRPGARPQPASS